MSSFKDQLQREVCVYTICDSTVSVMAGMSDTADELALRAYDSTTGASYLCQLSESALLQMQSSLTDQPDWASFFLAIHNAFHSGGVSVNRVEGRPVPAAAAAFSAAGADRGSNVASSLEVQCIGGVKGKYAVFILDYTADGQQRYIMEHLVRSHATYCHPKEFEQRLARLRTEEEAARAKRDGLDRELVALNENLTRNREKLKIYLDRKAELLATLGTHSTDNTDNLWKLIKEKEQKAVDENNQSQLANPLRDRRCKDFDPLLLRMIKSLYLSPEQCDSSSPADRVVMPFSQAELAAQVGLLDDKRAALWRALGTIDSWNFRVFDIQCAMSGDDYLSLSFQPNGGSLFVTLYALFCKNDFLHRFNIDEQVALNWISAVEAGYHGNPYHNSMHAADVLQITYFIIICGGLKKRCELSDLQVFAALLAAAIHDFDHPGINNNFHIKTSSHLATLYNDRSVLENLHVSSVFELMKNPAFDLLSSFSAAERHEIRDTMIEMVLATDMGSHGKYVASLKGKMQERSTFTKPEEQVLGLAIALKMADVSNCGRPLDIYLPWGAKVSDEFYQQGDRERNRGLDCSPFMNRLEPNLAKSQIAFMTYIISPFFEQIAELLPDMRFAVGLVEENKAYWACHDDS
ncbi:cAMP phosphodiesterase A (PDEA) [Leptomonas pyrrhocoris]|uniref:Phosphodiesterase n=1 Tax=Leptomonas pyrrhocoris TaxID=157538 RepID=A0A0M9FYL0_LEPPY|nr:cAMP phosphodiesterase A (PDEA) [Leptomonas pyrrhocoris]KPA78597.1 cAMP phosphodiesterase A (PDEA) [Leptomonas pyrrhocoris]|eukprot:XP_015657036.1 cAMP phosphodiesterase A (PDEA) [Leptomonas pyrrhocoris]